MASADMTEGRITPQLVKFTIPLVLGNIFQLLYNAVDSVIVGKHVGESALAAVGTASPIMNIALLFINGMCLGAGILMSSLYGAKDYDGLSKQISTTMIAGMIFSIVFSLFTIFIARPVLMLIKVPSEAIAEASDYLRIVFAGLVFTFIYNFLASTMRALGDSKTPLYFLVISSVINVFGDLFFVLVLNMGVKGSAISTVISEAICCLCCIVYIKRHVKLLCLGKKWFVFDKSRLSKTISYGSASAMQQVCLQTGKLIVQVMVNIQGVNAMAAFTAINRVDDFAYTPQQNIGHAMTTFLAQNKGAGKKKRMKQGFFCGLGIEMAYTCVLCAVIFIFSKNIMGLFVPGEGAEVINMGSSYLRLIAFMYFLPALTNCVQGYFRGIGQLNITLLCTAVNVGGRIAAVFIMLNLFSLGFNSLAWGNTAGWILMMAVELPMLFKRFRQLNTGMEG